MFFWIKHDTSPKWNYGEAWNCEPAGKRCHTDFYLIELIMHIVLKNSKDFNGNKSIEQEFSLDILRSAWESKVFNYVVVSISDVLHKLRFWYFTLVSIENDFLKQHLFYSSIISPLTIELFGWNTLYSWEAFIKFKVDRVINKIYFKRQ